ncbi:hypothetical protein [Paenibacillus sp. UNC499MF]|uniref:hypothetical protein n=1 Tax=Paenibacillus sp. UNC499MF TaxID=1502751 RepID=UPI00089FF969|nr:hypothetical protein [Paenibacillus sp. UNC499MF]SEG24114.1 hypothetical protein SAMN02799616_02266 [Paenibacillus sp. UNC499MF]
MKLQLLYQDYLNLKFNRKLPPVLTGGFEYGLCEDESIELFLAGRESLPFSEWISELQPRDPNYTANPDWKPVLSTAFAQLDVYEELIFYYLLFTVNTTTSIVKVNAYNEMNDFMKNYCFFQLSQLNDITALSTEQRAQLRDFFFFFYLYCHPVNEETLYSFSFLGHNLVHTRTGISVERYFSNYHDYYSENFDKYKDQMDLAPHEIQTCKNVTLELLSAIEGKSRLAMPHKEGLEDILQGINNVDWLIHRYAQNKAELFNVMADFLSDHHSSSYRDHCFKTLLQNYVAYILYFNFEEINALVDYFKTAPLWCEKIINAIFTDTIFIQKILRQNRIDIAEYSNVTDFFNERARSFYL